MHYKVKLMENQYEKSLMVGWLFFADETRTVRVARQQCVVVEHETSHMRFVDWRHSVYQPPYNYIKKFVILHSKSSTRGHILRVSPVLTSPHRAGPSSLLPLSLSLSPFRSPFACERATGHRDARGKLFP